jgi:hypothetical protein
MAPYSVAHMLKTNRATLGLSEVNVRGEREADTESLQLSHALTAFELALVSPYRVQRISRFGHAHSITETKDCTEMLLLVIVY